MDPVTASLINSASNVLGRALTPAPAAPSTANGGYADGQAFNNSPYDGSNWTVSTGSSKASATNGVHWNWLAIGAAVVVALYLVKHKGAL